MTISLSMNLTKGAYFTDIHFGKKSNSPIHNQDCLNFLEWFCARVQADPDINYIAFLGDWHESRTALDIDTQNYSYRGAKMLNELGLPIFFIVGNHDLGTRDSRDLYSTINFNEFENFIIVNDFTIASGDHGKTLFCPFLMPNEYSKLHDDEFQECEVWAGHFEFKGFVLTGYTIKLEHGPDHEQFKKQKAIMSGHFHRRQRQGNTHYIGNTFPMDYGDANLWDRGLATYDHRDDSLDYQNWKACPKYIKCNLSELLDDTVVLHDNSYVDVNVDVPVDYEELSIIEKAYTSKHDLREFKLDETSKFIESLMEDGEEEEEEQDGENKTTDQLIMDMLTQVKEDKFDQSMLIDIYREAKIDDE